ncbi:type II toxin-antitoxin system mRNA interferase toxin, RelE/StbE family [Candidatus Uhrbacteria bacterium]|nr:type II toxin-antitoxin system mRNA interferase toxin, RelE/StbE family [Candidatus Uhrbacteria bacterium]
MRVIYARIFDKQYKKLPQDVRENFKQRRNIFLSSPFDPLLQNHALHGRYAHYRSINITGDYRAVYREWGDDIIEFAAIGTHAQLYG